MSLPPNLSYTAFAGHRRLAAGSPVTVALAVKRAAEQDATVSILIFDDVTGRALDFDTSGTDEEVVSRLAPTTSDEVVTGPDGEPRGRGRPKLGVVAREVTLLPRHWDWLNAQPGGASVALRKLVEEARRANDDKGKKRDGMDAAYYFMSAMAGNFPGFEEAARALFAGEREQFQRLIAHWPQDVRDHAAQLAFAYRG